MALATCFDGATLVALSWHARRTTLQPFGHRFAPPLLLSSAPLLLRLLVAQSLPTNPVVASLLPQSERDLVLSTPSVQLAILLVTTNVSCLLQGNFNATVRCDTILAATFLLWKSVAWEEFLKEKVKDAVKQTLASRRPSDSADEDDIVFLFISYLAEHYKSAGDEEGFRERVQEVGGSMGGLGGGLGGSLAGSNSSSSSSTAPATGNDRVASALNSLGGDTRTHTHTRTDHNPQPKPSHPPPPTHSTPTPTSAPTSYETSISSHIDASTAITNTTSKITSLQGAVNAVDFGPKLRPLHGALVNMLANCQPGPILTTAVLLICNARSITCLAMGYVPVLLCALEIKNMVDAKADVERRLREGEWDVR